jgi:hypothetical protein
MLKADIFPHTHTATVFALNHYIRHDSGQHSAALGTAKGNIFLCLLCYFVSSRLQII